MWEKALTLATKRKEWCLRRGGMATGLPNMHREEQHGRLSFSSVVSKEQWPPYWEDRVTRRTNGWKLDPIEFSVTPNELKNLLSTLPVERAWEPLIVWMMCPWPCLASPPHARYVHAGWLFQKHVVRLQRGQNKTFLMIWAHNGSFTKGSHVAETLGLKRQGWCPSQ